MQNLHCLNFFSWNLILQFNLVRAVVNKTKDQTDLAKLGHGRVIEDLQYWNTLDLHHGILAQGAGISACLVQNCM